VWAVAVWCRQGRTGKGALLTRRICRVLISRPHGKSGCAAQDVKRNYTGRQIYCGQPSAVGEWSGDLLADVTASRALYMYVCMRANERVCVCVCASGRALSLKTRRSDSLFLDGRERVELNEMRN